LPKMPKALVSSRQAVHLKVQVHGSRDTLQQLVTTEQ